MATIPLGWSPPFFFRALYSPVVNAIAVPVPTGVEDGEETERTRLDAEMQTIAFDLSLKSTVAAQSYGGGSARPHASSTAPPGAGDAEAGHVELELLLKRYARAMSNSGRRRVIRDARTELETWQPKVKDTKEGINFEQVIIEDAEGYSAEMVGERYGISAHHVRRIRQRHERSINDGTALQSNKAGRLNPQERRTEAQRMHGKGMSKRQIALILGCNEGTIRNDLKALRNTD